MRNYIRTNSKGGVEIIILLIIIAASLAFVGGFTPHKKFTPPPGISIVSLKDQDANTPQSSLQLKAPAIITAISTPMPTPFTPVPTPIPTPKVVCNTNNGYPIEGSCYCPFWVVQCKNRQCEKIISYNNQQISEPDASNCIDNVSGLNQDRKYFDEMCDQWGRNEDGTYCVGKPVIYLYPEKKTLIDVLVETTGIIVTSDPIYPEGGWKNVLAYPDGTLIYQEKKYRELFYESSVSYINPPEKGIVVNKDDIEKLLGELNKKLGLTGFESKELTDFWVPRLKNLKSPYVFVSLIEKEEKEKIDKIKINPKPNILLEVLYYFKPLEKPVEAKFLTLPTTPKREGFVAVEWGGTIDFEN